MTSEAPAAAQARRRRDGLFLDVTKGPQTLLVEAIERTQKLELFKFLMYLVFFVLGVVILPQDTMQLNLVDSSIRNTFLTAAFDSPFNTKTLFDVATVDEMWEWMDKILVPGVFLNASVALDGSTQWVTLWNYLSQDIVFVQFRNDQVECLNTRKKFDRPCRGDTLTTESFGPNKSFQHTSYKFFTGSATGGFVSSFKNNKTFGLSELYYAVDPSTILTLPGHTAEEFSASIKHLRDIGWVDDYTRSLGVKLFFENVKLSITAGVSINFDFRQNGLVLPYAPLSESVQNSYVLVGRSRYYQTMLDRFRQFLEVCFLLYTFYAAVSECAEIRKSCRVHGVLHGVYRHYFGTDGLWNVVDMIDTVSSIFIIAMWLYLVTKYDYILQDTGIFGSFRALTTGKIILITLTFFKYLELNPFLGIITRTLRKAAKDLLFFFIIFVIVNAGYVVAGWYCFGQGISQFSSLVRGVYAVLMIIVGNYDFEMLWFGDITLGIIPPIYLFSLLIFGYFILTNMFLAIVINAYDAIRELNTIQALSKEKIRRTATVHIPWYYPLHWAYPSPEQLLALLSSVPLAAVARKESEPWVLDKSEVVEKRPNNSMGFVTFKLRLFTKALSQSRSNHTFIFQPIQKPVSDGAKVHPRETPKLSREGEDTDGMGERGGAVTSLGAVRVKEVKVSVAPGPNVAQRGKFLEKRGLFEVGAVGGYEEEEMDITRRFGCENDDGLSINDVLGHRGLRKSLRIGPNRREQKRLVGEHTMAEVVKLFHAKVKADLPAYWRLIIALANLIVRCVRAAERNWLIAWVRFDPTRASDDPYKYSEYYTNTVVAQQILLSLLPSQGSVRCLHKNQIVDVGLARLVLPLDWTAQINSIAAIQKVFRSLWAKGHIDLSSTLSIESLLYLCREKALHIERKAASTSASAMATRHGDVAAEDEDALDGDVLQTLGITLAIWGAGVEAMGEVQRGGGLGVEKVLVLQTDLFDKFKAVYKERVWVRKIGNRKVE